MNLVFHVVLLMFSLSKILFLVSSNESRWSLIAGRIPGRTDNEIKNYWNSHLSKKLISQGIDPRTHKPLISSSSTNPDPLLPEGPKIQPPSRIPYCNPNPNPNANPGSPIPSVHQQMGGGHGGVGTHDDRDGFLGSVSLEQDDGWQNTEGFASMDSQGSQGGGDSTREDDVLSSFLDSLINDDIFLQNQQQNIDSNDNNNNGQIQSNDPSISSAPGFGIGTLWESTFTSPVSLDEEILGQVVDHAAK